jgi:hypothetical protein
MSFKKTIPLVAVETFQKSLHFQKKIPVRKGCCHQLTANLFSNRKLSLKRWMDGKWSGNSFLLGSSSLANHGGYLSCFFLLPAY